MMHKAWTRVEEVPYCFARSSIKFQGRTALKIIEFDPDWGFPDCNSSFQIPQICLVQSAKAFTVFSELFWNLVHMFFILISKNASNWISRIFIIHFFPDVLFVCKFRVNVSFNIVSRRMYSARPPSHPHLSSVQSYTTAPYFINAYIFVINTTYNWKISFVE